MIRLVQRTSAVGQGRCASALRHRRIQVFGGPRDRILISTVARLLDRESWAAKQIKCGRYAGWTYASVAAEDPGYCTWVLKNAESQPLSLLHDFAVYLTAAHGRSQMRADGATDESSGVERVAFGKYTGWTFAQVVATDPAYCAWVREVAGRGSSGPLRNFANYLSAAQKDTLDATAAGPRDCYLQVPSGKYIGWTYECVAKEDPGYCAWVLRTVEPDSPNWLRKFASYLTPKPYETGEWAETALTTCCSVRTVGTLVRTLRGVVVSNTDSSSAGTRRHSEVTKVFNQISDHMCMPHLLAPFHISQTAWAAAKMQVYDEQLFNRLACATLVKIDEFENVNLVNTSWGFASVGRSDVELFSTLVAATLGKLDWFSVQEIATIARTFAKVGRREEGLYSVLAGAAIAKLGACNALDISMIAWSFATIRWSDAELFSALAASVATKINGFSGQNIANTAWAFAKVGRSDTHLFLALAAAAVSKITCFNEQEIANTAWAFAKVGNSNTRLFSALSTAAASNIHRFNEQNISKTAWAFAKVGRSDAQLFSALAAAAIIKIHRFNEQNIANTAWAFAKVGRSDAHLFSALAAAAIIKIHRFNEQNLANTAWAFAKIGRSDAHLFSALAAAAVSKMNNFNGQNLANTAWAFAKVGRRDAPLFFALAAAAVSKITDFNEQEIANTAWAFASTGCMCMELFSALASVTVAKIDGFTEQEVANTAWAFAKVGRSDVELFSVLAAASLNFVTTESNRLSHHSIDHITWAFVHADLPPTPLIEALLNAIVDYASAQGYACLKSEYGPMLSSTEGICAKIVSNLFPHALTSRNRFFLGFELDIAVEIEGRLVNIEIDGPTHNDPKYRDIDARRDAFLLRLGVHVVRVDVRGLGQHAELEDALVVSLRSAGFLVA